MLQKLALPVLYAFVFSIPMDVWPVPAIGSVTQATGIVLAAVGGTAVLSRGQLHPFNRAQWSLAVFALWAAASLTWSADTQATVQRVGTYAQLLVFLFLYSQLVRGERELRGSAIAYVLGAATVAVGTLIAYAQGQAYRDEVRYAVAGYDPNDLGLTLAIALPMAWFFAVQQAGWPRTVGLTYLPLALLGTALTASRGATLASLAALTIIPASIRRSRGRTLALSVIAAAAAAGALIYFVPESSWERLVTTKEQIAAGTMTHRRAIWLAGWDLFLDNWTIGVGAGAFATAIRPALNWSIAAHNTALSIGAELGVIGLALFFAAGALALRQARHCPPAPKSFVRVSLFTWLIGASSLTWEYRKSTWFLMALLIGTVYLRSEEDSPEGNTPPDEVHAKHDPFSSASR